jgi:hypothetical protein
LGSITELHVNLKSGSERKSELLSREPKLGHLKHLRDGAAA